MWRSLASNAFTIFIVIALALGAVVTWGQSQYRSAGPLTQAICLKVDRGASMRRLSRDLESRDAVSNGSIFRIGADYTGKSELLKAGSFLVPEGSSMEQIVEIVTRGGQSTCGREITFRIGVTRAVVGVRELDPATNEFVQIAEFDAIEEEAPEAYSKAREDADARYRVILAEGVTSWQVVEGIKAADFLNGEVAEVPAEGSLAPDSYEIQAGDDRGELLAKMTAAQSAVLAAAWEARNPDVPLATPEEALILASIVEKETGVPEERKQVASVFVNRLNRGMRLQTDPTVIYGITRGQGVLGRGLRQSELRRETPWNTYTIDGLPQTPIANPGREAIAAALNPDDTPFIFFVADGTGGHAFAETLEKHNENVARWRQIEAERANQ